MSVQDSHYMYYPGCSLQASARSYDISAKKVADVLNLRFEEVVDWNCCGATEYFSINSIPAYSLVARNLALASDQGYGEMVAPCSACYLNLHKTDAYMGKHDDLNAKVNQALAAGGLEYQPGSLNIRHLLDMLVEDVGYDTIAANVSQPLKGLRVAPYYGCLIARPGMIEPGTNPEYPTHLDKLLQALGATVVDFPLKTHCCGGHMTQISENVAYELIRRIVHNADEYAADAIVTVCPMCQLNLDAYQPEVNRTFGTAYGLPVLYFTQVMGLAFGLSPEEVGIGSEIVSAAGALSKIGQEEDEKTYRPKRRDKSALPMPSSRR